MNTTVLQRVLLLILLVSMLFLFTNIKSWATVTSTNKELPVDEDKIIEYIQESWHIIETAEDIQDILSLEDSATGIPFSDEIGGILVIIEMKEDIDKGDYAHAFKEGGRKLLEIGLRGSGYTWLTAYVGLASTAYEALNWFAEEINEDAFNTQIQYYIAYREDGFSEEEMFKQDNGWLLRPPGGHWGFTPSPATDKYSPEDVFRVGRATWDAMQADQHRTHDETAIKESFEEALSIPANVGSGASNFQVDPQLFVNCYNRNVGAEVFDEPINEVHRWGNGYIQDFRKNGNESAIMKPNSWNKAFAIYGAIWAKYKKLAFDESDSQYPPSYLGYPISDEEEAWQSRAQGFDTRGRVQNFEHGHLYYHRTGNYTGKTFETHGAIDDLYTSMGGSRSWLGFPISDEYPNPSGHSQSDFEGGYITHKDDGGDYWEAYSDSDDTDEPEEFPGENATNLSDYYSAWDKDLPSLNERAKIYECLSLGLASNYTGSSQQNTQLLNVLKQRQTCPSTVDELECEDITLPTITTKIPTPDATNVSITTNISITFSEPMNQSATESAFSITPTVAGSKSWQGNTLVFNPTDDLEYQETYQITISSSATDLAGNSLEKTEWSFTTIKEGTTCFLADLDCNGKVDIADVRLIASYWDTQQGDARYNSDYDFNEDGKINLFDVRTVAQYWGQTEPFTLPAVPSLVDISTVGIDAEKAVVKVTPSAREVVVDKKATISIEIKDVINLGAVEFTLRYNPNIIEIQTDTVKIGGFLPENQLLPLGPQFKDVDALKELTYGLSLLGNKPGPSGDGILVQITVQTLDSGTTTLDLTDVQIVDATLQLKPIPVEIKNSSITVLPEVMAGIEGIENSKATIQTNSTSETLPTRNRLLQNYPNPFNPETWIPYQLAEPANVQISIYNVSGRLIRNLDLGYQNAGYYQDKQKAASWNGRNNRGEEVANGVYFYTIKADRFTATRQMVIVK